MIATCAATGTNVAFLFDENVRVHFPFGYGFPDRLYRGNSGKTSFQDRCSITVPSRALVSRAFVSDADHRDYPERDTAELNSLFDEGKKTSHNFYEDEFRVYVKRWLSHSWITPSKWNHNCVKTSFARENDWYVA